MISKDMWLTVAIGLMLMDEGGAQQALTWRAQYEAGLRAPQGWLSLAGLFWLREGINTISLPARCGVQAYQVEFHAGRANLRPMPGVTVNDAGGNEGELLLDKSTVEACGTSATYIQRGKRFGIRLRDPEAKTRRDFKGLTWFPINEQFRLTANWHPYNPPKQIPITNILGDTDNQPSPGYAEFVLGKTTFRLEPVVEDGKLFFMFRDATSTDSTYGSGRFLKAAMPDGNVVELDFNRAYNPPCAYTEFATCPLPPRQNRIAVRIEAGEKRYGAH